MILGLKKGKKTKHEIEAIIREAEAKVKLEILATGKIKVKILKGLYFHQQTNKTKLQEITLRIMVINMIKRKETFFRKIGQLQKKIETVVITTNGNN